MHHMAPALTAFPDQRSVGGGGGFENEVAVSTSVECGLEIHSINRVQDYWSRFFGFGLEFL